MDDCASVSRQVSGVLDVEDPITGEYTLEVSSPGVDRLMFRLEHYLMYVGEWIEIRTLQDSVRSTFEFGCILSPISELQAEVRALRLRLGGPAATR